MSNIGYQSEFNAGIKYLEQLCKLVDEVNICYKFDNMLMSVKILDTLQNMVLPRLEKTSKENLSNLIKQRDTCVANAIPKYAKNPLLKKQVHEWFASLNIEIHRAGLMMTDKAGSIDASWGDEE